MCGDPSSFLVGVLRLMALLDVAKLSNRHSVPSRACAYCFWRYQLSWVEDEWHILLVCPLYSNLRAALPFTSDQVRVEGHVMQGEGCTERNLTSLVSHIMDLPSFDVVVDFFRKATKKRRDSRHNPFIINRLCPVQLGRSAWALFCGVASFCGTNDHNDLSE